MAGKMRIKKKIVERRYYYANARAVPRARKQGKHMRGMLCMLSLLFVFVCYQAMSESGHAPAMGQIWNYIKEEVAVNAWKNCMASMVTEEQEKPSSLGSYVLGKLGEFYPICGYSETLTDYDTQIESDLAEGLLAENQQGNGEGHQKEPESKKGKNEGKEEKGQKEAKGKEDKAKEGQDAEAAAKGGPAKPVEISREKLKDFDYLLQNFYQVDRTTTIDSSQLNVDALLGKSMKLGHGNEETQILIYHTHSQEGYADSTPGDTSTGVVGVAEYLTSLLKEKYGLNVMHHTGEYDVEDRDNAYSYSGPALEKILAENPSIEVVIDLHRDGVADTTHLVSEVNGKQTAQIMFFNGLSRTTANGDIPYLANPYLAENLAFSFQMKLAAEEYYPGFARANYLKGYRYNLHYRPKSLLIEVGAQTNTLEEAKNAMEPLADLLHKVLAE